MTEQKNVLSKAGAFISVTLPILIAIVTFSYYIIVWNNNLTKNLDALNSRIDKSGDAAALRDSLKSRDISELKNRQETDHTLLKMHDSQLVFLMAQQCAKGKR